MGEVYRATGTKLKREVAIKVLDFGLAKALEPTGTLSNLNTYLHPEGVFTMDLFAQRYGYLAHLLVGTGPDPIRWTV